MKKIKKKVFSFLILIIMSVFWLFAEKTPIEHLYYYTLDNGLSVYVAENHSAPLVYIELAVRAGAVAQTPENAGLFHLYEHMMFKGNTKYPNAQAMQTALKNMGVPSWNGTTSIDRVNYYITVPVDQFEKGLEFWSYALREPLMTKKEFEDEKKVVISEIQGYFGMPSEQQQYFTVKKLFPQAPWTMDACGPVEVIQNATVEQLRTIQKKYYIPNNTAVFVGGDVNPDEVYQLVKKIFGDWKKGDDPWEEAAEAYAANPLQAPLYCVIPYAELSPALAQVEILYHGPDADYNLKDTYTADVFTTLLSDPEGIFKKTLLNNKKLQIAEASHIWSGYQTSRRHGLLSFGAVMLNPAEDLPARTKDFFETVTKKALPAVQKDKNIASKEKNRFLLQLIRDGRVLEAQSANSLLASLSYFWTYSTKDYYMSYEENLMKVKNKDFDPYLETYVYNRNPLIKVFVNPQVYEETKENFDKAGFVLITPENAFWWNNSQGADK